MLKRKTLVFAYLLSLCWGTVYYSTPSQAQKKPTETSQEVVLWDSWYTIQTSAPPLPFAYYHERVVKNDGRIIYQSHMWKKEDQDINEEHMGAFALDDEFLTPLSYNYYSRFGLHETKVDGSIQNKRASIKAQQGEKSFPMVQKMVPQKTILSAFFPVYLARIAPKMKPTSQITFRALMEDNIEQRFKIETGQVRMGKPDEASKRTQSTKLNVRFGRVKSTWYILPSGEPVGIAMLNQGLVITRVTEEKAKNFFNTKIKPKTNSKSLKKKSPTKKGQKNGQ